MEGADREPIETAAGVDGRDHVHVSPLSLCLLKRLPVFCQTSGCRCYSCSFMRRSPVPIESEPDSDLLF
jgi:hypothetical protein